MADRTVYCRMADQFIHYLTLPLSASSQRVPTCHTRVPAT